MQTREDILQFLRNNKERFAEKYGVTKLGLFGSFARDEATEESDVDVCVEIIQPTYSQMFDLREEIVEKTSRSVDLVRVRHGMNALLKKRIENGKLICALPSLAEIKAHVQTDIDSFDSTYKRLLNPHIYKVSITEKLRTLKLDLIQKYLGIREN